MHGGKLVNSSPAAAADSDLLPLFGAQSECPSPEAIPPENSPFGYRIALPSVEASKWLFAVVAMDPRAESLPPAAPASALPQQPLPAPVALSLVDSGLNEHVKRQHKPSKDNFSPPLPPPPSPLFARALFPIARRGLCVGVVSPRLCLPVNGTAVLVALVDGLHFRQCLGALGELFGEVWSAG